MKALVIILSLVSFSAFAQQYSSQTECHAYTTCFDYYGNPVGVARCDVYGSTYISNGGNSNNACSWAVYPGQGVQCAGYAQVQNQFGQWVWSWQNFQAACPR